MQRPVHILAVALAFALGCSSTAESTPADLAAALCKKRAECTPVSLAYVYGDEATCRSRTSLSLTLGLAASSGADIGACASAFGAMSCDEYLSNRTPPPAACDFRGSSPNGTACGIDWQCASGFCNFAGACGVCADAPKAGDACVGYRCGPGLVCSKDTRCIVPGTGGATCATNADCDTAFSCVGTTCAARVGPGVACASDGSKPGCALELFCGPAKVCTAFKTANLGESCGVVGSDYALCKGGYCKSSGSSGSGTCAAYAGDGQACGSGAAECEPPATCVSGVCKLRDPAACK